MYRRDSRHGTTLSPRGHRRACRGARCPRPRSAATLDRRRATPFATPGDAHVDADAGNGRRPLFQRVRRLPAGACGAVTGRRSHRRAPSPSRRPAQLHGHAGRRHVLLLRPERPRSTARQHARSAGVTSPSTPSADGDRRRRLSTVAPNFVRGTVDDRGDERRRRLARRPSCCTPQPGAACAAAPVIRAPGTRRRRRRHLRRLQRRRRTPPRTRRLAAVPVIVDNTAADRRGRQRPAPARS